MENINDYSIEEMYEGVHKSVGDLSSEQMLELIYEFAFEDNKDNKQLVFALYDTVRLSPIEFNYLAWLNRNKDKVVTSEDFFKLSGVDLITQDCILTSLEGKGYIYITADGLHEICDNINLLSIPEPAVSPSDEENGNAELTDYEIIEKLKQILSEDDEFESKSVSDEAISCLVADMGKRPDFQFCKGFNYLSKGLSLEEQRALFILASQFVNNGIKPLCGFSKCDYYYKKGVNGLVGRCIATIVPNENDNNNYNGKDRVRLTPTACHQLFAGLNCFIDYASLSHQGRIIKYEDIRYKELFFEEGDIYNIESMRNIVDKERYKAISQRLASKSRRCGITCLLYGAPGTGKTELCKQLARMSKRDIFLVEPAMLNGAYWGDSERNYREIFDNFKYLFAITPEAPIMVFNEADGILQKRSEGTRSIEKSQNTVQNIILQCLEDFEGILIATTNLVNNFDEAFERRFIIKVEFHRPSSSTRLNIWQSLIPDLCTTDAQALANEFTLSGGKIVNVATKRDIHEVIYGDTPSFEKMREFCLEETIESIHAKKGINIKGFTAYNNN